MSGFGLRDAFILLLYCSLSLAFFFIFVTFGSVILQVIQRLCGFRLESSLAVALLIFPCSFYGFKFGTLLTVKLLDQLPDKAD